MQFFSPDSDFWYALAKDENGIITEYIFDK